MESDGEEAQKSTRERKPDRAIPRSASARLLGSVEHGVQEGLGAISAARELRTALGGCCNDCYGGQGGWTTGGDGDEDT